MIWGKHQLDTKHHYVIEIERKGSMVTTCSGRWNANEGQLYLEGEPPEEQCCRACWKAVKCIT